MIIYVTNIITNQGKSDYFFIVKRIVVICTFNKKVCKLAKVINKQITRYLK